jgi:SAM-dependent methyltransferase
VPTCDDSELLADTTSAAYARRLQAKQRVWWKRVLPVQAPYRWNLRRQRLGRTLDVGCGIGRNLGMLTPSSVGVDHNAVAVRVARESGATVLTTEEWKVSALRRPETFDGLLVAHVLEHLEAAPAEELLRSYLPYLKSGGRVFLVCPQERGYASDPTHVRFVDGEDMTRLAAEVGLVPQPWFSFPFPRRAGRAFVYNEFCLLATKPG